MLTYFRPRLQWRELAAVLVLIVTMCAAVWIAQMPPNRLFAAVVAIVATIVLLSKGLLFASRALIVSAPLPLVVQSLGVDVRVLFLPAFVLVLFAVGRQRASRASVSLVVVLATQVAAGAVGTENVTAQMYAVLSIGAGISFVLLLMLVARQTSLASVLNLLVLGAAVTCVIAIAASATGLVLPGAVSSEATTSLQIDTAVFSARLAGPVGDYELFASYLAAMTMVAVWLSLRAHALRYISLSALLILTGLATGSRSFILLTIIGIVPLLIIERIPVRRIFAVMAAAMLVGLLAAPTLLKAIGASALDSRIVQVNLSGNIDDLLNRAKVWRDFSRVAGSDWGILGNGPAYPLQSIGFYPHSTYIYLLFTAGGLGLAAVVGTWCYLLLRISTARNPAKSLAVCLLIVVALDGLKVEPFRFFHAAVICFWVPFAFAFCVLDKEIAIGGSKPK